MGFTGDVAGMPLIVSTHSADSLERWCARGQVAPVVQGWISRAYREVEENDAIASSLRASDTCIMAILALGATELPEVEWPERDRALVRFATYGGTYGVNVTESGPLQVSVVEAET